LNGPSRTSLENYPRSEKALLATICQMIEEGVSTNRVKEIVNRLSPNLSYFKSTVRGIDGKVILQENWD